mmetsp:Transcript_98003/g.189226  ORF Transcript_98003/g.189226 Transcript_98003/m.189226 type:complete len:350 (-) Transcript_98003:260-1309(-)
MEVTVLSATGAASDLDSIVSIRAGTSRRQGAVQLEKKLHFPVSFQEANPFKVDLLRHVGSGQATLNPDPQDEVYAVPLEPPVGAWDNKATAQLHLRVSTRPLLCGRNRAEGKANDPIKSMENMEDPLQGAAAQARRYFDDHNVMRLVQALLEALVRDQPDDPWEYMGKFWDCLSSSNQESIKKQEPDVGAVVLNDVARLRTNPQWVAAFETLDLAGTGALDVNNFCIAIRSVHPDVSESQARALAQGVAPGGSSVGLAAFCAAVEAVAGGNALAAEVAGMNLHAFVALRASAAAPLSDTCGGAADAGQQQPPTFRDLREVHASLSNENARLNNELARLLARASQHRSEA